MDDIAQVVAGNVLLSEAYNAGIAHAGFSVEHAILVFDEDAPTVDEPAVSEHAADALVFADIEPPTIETDASDIAITAEQEEQAYQAACVDDPDA